MEYKFTFEDGSAAIAHHGVKGMKWGVWNAETQARYNGTGQTAGGVGGYSDEDDPELNARVEEELKKMIDSYTESTGHEPSKEDLAKWKANVTESQRKRLQSERTEAVRRKEDEAMGYSEEGKESKGKVTGGHTEPKTTQDKLEALDRKYGVEDNGPGNAKKLSPDSDYENNASTWKKYKEERERILQEAKHSAMGRPVYLFTLDDGSEALVHYGVQGMKWGQHLFGDIKEALGRAAGGAAEAIQDGVDHAREILFGKSEENAETPPTEAKAEEEPQKESKPALSDEQVADLAYAVIRGDWGNGQERYDKLQDSGYSYEKVQTKVNDIIYGTNDYAEGRNTSGAEDREDIKAKYRQ